VNLIHTIQKVVEPLKRRILLSISRAVVKSVTDSGGMQVVKLSLMADEVKDGVERFQRYGFTSNPPAGSEAVVVFVSGDREHGVVVAENHRASRKKGLAEGESALYNSEGSFIHLKNGGKVIISNGTEELVSILSDLVQGVLDARTNTLNGPQPLLPAGPFTTAKSKLDSMKG